MHAFRALTLLFCFAHACIFADFTPKVQEAIVSQLNESVVYAPWREKLYYNHPTECAFCLMMHENRDEDNFILGRFKYHVVMLNLYPYNSGHLLIVPTEHVTDILELNAAAHAELMELIVACTAITKKKMHCEGINIGINIGKASGASVPHVHTHILPRWICDRAYIHLLAKTAIIEMDLRKVYAMLKPAFVELAEKLEQKTR